MSAASYSELMAAQPAHLTLKLDTAEPVELEDFVGAFTSLANEFQRYVADKFPGAKSDPRIYIKEVRSGCIEADMITGLAAGVSLAMTSMDQILILEDFVKRWGRRLTHLIRNDTPDAELTTPSELADFLRATESIASDPVASHRLEAAVFEDQERKVRAVFEFSAVEARTAQQHIEDRKLLLAAKTSIAHSRVLMRFTRLDVHDATLNKKSGERVLIAAISPNEHAVMYASEIAEREIREHIREADENAFKRGFVVDVVAQMHGEKIVAYSITAVHSIIDLD